MGVDLPDHEKIKPAEKSVMRKIWFQLSKFMGWIAKGHDGKLPCAG